LEASSPEITVTVGKYPGGNREECDAKIYNCRVVTVAAALPFLGGTAESYAAEGPWCHTYGGSQGTIENCRVQTLEMCRFEIQGNGGSCSPDPHWPGLCAAAT
jgi:hypothetical protein